MRRRWNSVPDLPGAVIYHDLPAWVFTLVYTVFGGAVVLMWILAPPAGCRCGG